MDRVTFIVPWEKSEQLALPQAGRSCQENQRSLSYVEIVYQSLEFSGRQYRWCSTSRRTLTDEMDRIAVKQLISASAIKEDGHQIANLGATALRQRQTSKPRFDLYCSNFSQLMVSPMGTNPSVQIYLVRLFRRVAAPRVIFREFSLLKVIAELRDRSRGSTNPRLLRIDLCQQDRDSGTGRRFVWIMLNRANYFLPLNT